MALFSNALLGALLFAILSISSPLDLVPNAQDIEITLTSITYTSTTNFWSPGSVRSGDANIMFDIYSPQFPSMHCAAATSEGGYSDDYFRFQPITYSCDAPSGGSSSPATFTYNRNSNRITVNQTWTGSANRGSVATYSADASGKVKFTCNSNTWINPDWRSDVGGGIDYSTKRASCKGSDLKLSIDRLAMNGPVIENPSTCTPATYSCTPGNNGWQVCNTSGVWEFAGSCSGSTTCVFNSANGSPYCL